MRRFGDSATGDLSTGRNPREIFLDKLPRVRHVDVAGDNQNGVVGNVISVEEFLELADSGGLQMAHVANGRPAIGVLDKGELEEVFKKCAVRLVLLPTPFLGHHLALDIVNLFRDLETGHAIRFQIKRHLQMIRGQCVHVNRLVETRKRIRIAANHVDQLHVLLGLYVCRATKHHVLKHVGESLAIRPLVAAANVIEDAHVDHGGLMEGRVDRPQAVGKGFFGEVDGLRGGQTMRAEDKENQQREARGADDHWCLVSQWPGNCNGRGVST